jgi:hypothetical protein
VTRTAAATGVAVVGLFALAVAHAQPPKPARAGPAPKPAGTLAQIMRGVYFPNANLIFDVQQNDPAAPKKKAEGAAGSATSMYGDAYTGWEVVENAAIALTDGVDLILKPGRLCQNGKPVPVQQADFKKFAGDMRQAGVAVLTAAHTRNQEKVSDATNDLADAGRQSRPVLAVAAAVSARVLVYLHRWLGIAGCLLFAAWFASGIVMIYVRMPELDPESAHAGDPPLDFSHAHVDAREAARALASAPQRVGFGMFDGRPVYRFWSGGTWTTIFADNGQALQHVTGEQALAAVRRFAPRHAATAALEATLTAPDQWTLQQRALLPMHRIALHDADDTDVYVSDRTGQLEMRTTRRERRWAYAGPVIHWLYFTPLRRHSTLWAQSIIWLSIAGCVMCLAGLIWGIVVGARSPYVGIMRWHHYAGLIVGVATCTWIFSGLLSMDPWDWHPSTAPTRAQRDAVAGGSLRLELVTAVRVQRALGILPAAAAADLVQFRGEPFAAAGGRLAPLAAPERGAIERFDDDAVAAAAREAMPGVPVEDLTWLTAYDAYYYDRDRGLPLPALRVRFADSARTWLYLDPARGAIARKEERLSRANRWLYHGLHSLDFPFLYWRRPLWDMLLIALSVGGLVSSLTSLWPAWRRLRRHGRRFVSPADIDSEPVDR